jgi:hypothetical protein
VNNLTLNRTVGFEFEGYVETHPEYIQEIPSFSIGSDGSLSNNGWYRDEPYGVEVRSEPLRNIGKAENAFGILLDNGWGVDSSAGTHIHIDISDFSLEEKVKLLRFGKGIENIMFMLVDDYRKSNSYCMPITKWWRSFFWKSSPFANIDWEEAEKYCDEHGEDEFTDYLQSEFSKQIWNGKYQWMNVFGSNYPTVEFRLYHAIDNSEEAIEFALLSYHIVETVKNSTIEHLQYIIKSLYESTTIEEVLSKFVEAIGLPFTPSIKGQNAGYNLREKLTRENNQQAQAV